MIRVLCAGSFVCDLIAAGLPGIPAPGELMYSPGGIELSAGGHSANVAIDLSQLGHEGIAAAGCIGEDLFGDYIEGELRQRNVRVYAERVGVPTAKNIALVVEGEDRRFIAELTANKLLSVDFLTSALQEAKPEIFYLGTVGGLRHIDENLVGVLNSAKDLGCLTVVDVIMPSGFGWGHLTSAMPMIDVLHCNALEGAALTGDSEPAEAADHLLDDGVKMALITLGSEGLVAATFDLSLRMPAFKVSVLDPTGAGDAFCAGFISAVLDTSIGPPLNQSLRTDTLKLALLRGEAAGASCVSGIGATSTVTREAVENLIREQGEEVWASSKTTRGDLF